MACLHPLVIRNRRYVRQPDDYMVSQLLLHPEDVARQRILVPCGRCSECLRAERNAWYVRLNREIAYQRRIGGSVWFVTLTVAPRFYKECLDSPSSYIRRFFETIRHRYGKSIKHAFFQEIAPKKGRLHFHGLLFGSYLSYRDLHDLNLEFGWMWISPATTRSARYVVKYVCKDLGKADPSGQLLDSKYRRKFVSSHVGDYLGSFPPKSDTVSTWSFRDNRCGRVFKYAIPRYYNKYITPEALRRIEVRNGLLCCDGNRDDFASRVCMEAFEEVTGRSAVDFINSGFYAQFKRSRELLQSFYEFNKTHDALKTLYYYGIDSVHQSFG